MHFTHRNELIRRPLTRLSVTGWIVVAAWYAPLFGDIEIAGDDWDKFAISQSEGTLPFIETTDGGTKSLVMPTPNEDKSILYGIEVTGLSRPGADGTQRIAVRVSVRNAGASVSSMGIRNLTLDDRLPPDQQSVIAILFANDDTGEAQDDSGIIDEPGLPGAPGVIGNVVQENNTKASPEATPPSVVETENTTLELRMGFNLLRIDPTDPIFLGSFQYVTQSGWQAFSIALAPGDAGVTGEVVPICGVTRSFSAERARPGTLLTVTLDAKNLAGETTIRETLPDGWTVTDAGGGTVDAAAGTITFTTSTDGQLSYTESTGDS